jgi:hypothetical protein
VQVIMIDSSPGLLTMAPSDYLAYCNHQYGK